MARKPEMTLRDFLSGFYSHQFENILLIDSTCEDYVYGLLDDGSSWDDIYVQCDGALFSFNLRYGMLSADAFLQDKWLQSNVTCFMISKEGLIVFVRQELNKVDKTPKFKARISEVNNE